MRSFAFRLSAAFCVLLAASAASADQVDDLIKQLGDDVLATEAAAADTLVDKQGNFGSIAGLGPAAAKAVPALANELGDESEDVRWRVARALGAIGPAAEAAVPALTKALDDESAKVRAYSAYALGQIGKPASAAGPKLISMVTDEDPLVRRAALRALRIIRLPSEQAIPLMAQVLQDADPRVVVHALNSMAELGEEGVPVLTLALDHPQAKYWACLVLAEIGPAAKSAAPKLVELLKDPEEEVRMQAAIALGEIGPEAAPVAAEPLIVALQEDKAGGVRYGSAFALGKMKAAKADEALRAAAAGDDAFLQLTSVWALMEINPNDESLAEKSVELIIAGLKSEDNPALQHAAAHLVAESKVSNEKVAEHMIAALNGMSPEAVASAINALAAQGKNVVPRLLGGLKNEQLRPYALRVLMKIGPDAEGAAPALVELLDTEDPALKSQLQFALGRIGGPAAAPAVPKLVSSLESENVDVVRSALFALGKIGPEAADALPVLRQRLLDPEEPFKIGVVWAILRIRPEDQRIHTMAVPLLIRALDNEMEVVRYEAAVALGDIGGPAVNALPKLREVAEKDLSEAVRSAAGEAVTKIEGKQAPAPNSLPNPQLP